jgi:hypothetical protein
MTHHGAPTGGTPGRTWSARLAARLTALGPAQGPAFGRVTGLAVAPGLVTALVLDDAPTPWRVRLTLPVLSDAEWRRIWRALVADTDAREQLLDGELPPDTDALFARSGLPLLPAADGELLPECGCPDGPQPCAHLAAVLAALGAAFDDEPFLLTAWRGRDRRAVLDAVRDGPAPGSLGDGPLGDDPFDDGASGDSALDDGASRDGPFDNGAPGTVSPGDGFWDCGDLPERRAAAPAPAVTELGRPAVTVRGRSLADTLAPAYEAFLTW